MQALILAAGKGVRLNELGIDCPKCLLTINGKKLIDRVIESLEPYGHLSRIVVVVNYQADKIINYLNSTYPNLPFYFVDERPYPAFNRNNLFSFDLALSHLTEDTLLFESDIIFDPSIIRGLVETRGSAALGGLWAPYMDGTALKLEKGKIKKVEPLELRNPALSPIYKTVNIYKLSSFCLKYLKWAIPKFVKKWGYNHYYEEAFDWRLFNLVKVDNRLWYEIDTPSDYYVAEIMFSEGKKKYELMNKRWGGYWRFPKLIDACYLQNKFYRPTKTIELMKQGLNNLIGCYPSGEWEVRKNAARIYNVKPENILVGNGATELIKILGELYKDKTFHIDLPTFNEYINWFKLDKLEEFDKAEVVIVVNPNNPTNDFIKEADMLKMIISNPNKLFIVDESFMDFADQELQYSLKDFEFDNVIIIRSLGKTFNINGLKLGVVISTEDHIKEIKNLMPSWNTNGLAQEFLTHINMKEYKEACIALAAERHHFIDKLKTISNINVCPSQTNFLTIELDRDAYDFCVMMFDKYNIYIKDLTEKVGKNFIRLAINNKEENDYVVRCFKKELY